MKLRREITDRGGSSLIVVVAILVIIILVAVLAPHFLRFVGLTELERDTRMLEGIRKAVQTALVEGEEDSSGLSGVGFSSENGFYKRVYSEAIAVGKDYGYVPEPPTPFFDVALDKETPVGRAVVKMLGYTDVTTMMDPNNGLITRILSESPEKCSIWLWIRGGREVHIALARLTEGELEWVASVPRGEEDKWWFYNGE